MDNQQKLTNALKKIDDIYNATIEKLEVLHQRKIDLIREYKKKAEIQVLQKIRKEIK